MIKNKKTKMTLSIILTMILSSCGGGSGVSGEYSNQPTVQPIISNNKSDVKNLVGLKSKSALDRKSSIGTGVNVILSDSGINLHDRELVDKNIETYSYVHYGNSIKKEIVTQDFDTNEFHGTRMAKIITKNAPGSIITSAIAEHEQNTVSKGWETIGEVSKDKKNIDIVNTSWVGRDDLDFNYGDSSGARHVVNVIKDGAIFVTAAGNYGLDNASLSSSLAMYENLNKDISHGYITVTGVNVDGNILKDYNKCGKKAMNFCISSYSEYRFANDNENGKYVKLEGNGTSAATAYTTSVLSKVKSRYDWMSNRDLKNTLFTTAVDLGTPGIDEIYGVGMLNEGAALGGYGRFDYPTTLNVSGKKQSYYFDNNIYGLGSIIKNGNKTLVLNGNNTFSGTNVINSGELVLNGTNVASTKVNNSGVLSIGDSDKITSGSILNNGVINSLTTGNIVINGNLTSTGIINKNVGSKINVTGDTNLNNSKFIVHDVVSGYVTKNGKREVLLSTNNLIGDFELSKSNNGVLVDSKFEVNNKEIALVVKRDDVVSASFKGSEFNGKESTSKNIEKTLTKFDEIIDGGGKLTEKQNEFAISVVKSTNLNESLFDNSGNTFKNANENVLNNEIKQNNKFIKDGLSNNDVWLDYDYSKAKIDINGLDGTGKNNNVTFGYAQKIDNSHRLAIGVSTKNYSWSEVLKIINKNIDTKSNGIDLAYYFTGFNDYNLFTNIGVDWLKVKNNFDKSNGKQYSLMLGANRVYELNDKFKLTPSLSLSHVNTKHNEIKLNDYVKIEKMKTKQMTATVDIAAEYSITDNVKLNSSVALSQDLNKKSKYNINYVDVKSSNKDSNIGKSRVNASVGLSYSPVEKLNISLITNYEKGKNFNRITGNANVGYKF